MGGNAYTYIDGCNIKACEWFVCADPSKYNDTQFSAGNGYTSIGVAPSANGYLKNFMFSNVAPWAFAPGEVGGGSTTYIPDYYYQNTGSYAPCVGSHAGGSSPCGAWYWNASHPASYAFWYYGARLLYRTPA